MVEAATELVLMISMGAAEVSGKEDVASRDVVHNVAVDEMGVVAEVSDAAVVVSKLVIKTSVVAVNVVSELVITISEAVVGVEGASVESMMVVVVSELVIDTSADVVNGVESVVVGNSGVETVLSENKAAIVDDTLEKGVMVEAASELVLMILMGAAEVSGKEDVVSRDVNNNVTGD
ncbi:hypothetical protein Q8A73_009742 [Channa argus]|nr:hypothetical protein Q8A73_009742 [Channa argus]